MIMAHGRDKPWTKGDLLRCKEIGQVQVRNVTCSSHDKGSKRKFWDDHSGRDFSKQKCAIKGCGNMAKVGGHVWVKDIRSFCFILPICQSCNMKQSLQKEYRAVKKEALLVARKPAKKCTLCGPSSCGT